MPLIAFQNGDVSADESTNSLLSGAVEAPWNLFPSYSATDDIYLEDARLFLTSVCTRDGEQLDSCNAICGEAEALFSSWTTLWNCLTLASL